MSDNYEIHKQDLAGFDLCGWRLPDGHFQMHSGLVLSELPAEVELLGNVYTLEETQLLGDPDEFGRVFFNAIYV